MGQQMKLAPRMIQSMEILQLPAQALEERIEQELENNPTLELLGPESEEGEEPDRDRERDEEHDTLIQERELDLADGADDFERLSEMESTYAEAFDNDDSPRDAPRQYEDPIHRPTTRADGDRDAKMDAMANTATRVESLGEQLLRQWSLAEADERTRELGEFVIGFIEDDGLIHTPSDDIAAKAPPGGEPVTADDIDEIIIRLQRALEPTGVAARDVQECILLQIEALERDEGISYETERDLIENHYDDLLRNRLPRIAERSGLTMDQIVHAIERMHHLDFAPGRQLAAEAPHAVTPDVIVRYDEESDQYVAILNDRTLRSLRINEDYLAMARDRAIEKQTRDFIKTNLRNAQWLLDAVSQRSHTLLRVVNAVLSAQRDFFDEGPEALRPLPMTQVADQLGIHVATVSRAVSGKHIDTPRGIFPLRQFFSGGTQTESGEEVSWDAVRAKLKELVDNEDKANPLSDDALAEALKAGGVEIARRTVAKYRNQLSIPSARLRRKYDGG